MEYSQYQEQALRSEKPLETVHTDRVLLVKALVAAEAMANLVDRLKKSVVYGKAIDYAEFRRLSDDVLEAASNLYDHTVYSEDPRKQAPAQVVEVDPRLLHAALGYFGEAGEIFAALLHQINTGELDLANLEEENGDMSWYDALFCDRLVELGGADKVSIWRMNIAKLKARYPQLFSLAESEGRNVGAERAAMEEARCGSPS